MKLVLADTGYLKDSISIISELVNEARFRINKNALELVAMDPANVAMVVFKLFSSSFAEYNVPKETEIAINLVNLKQILRRVSANDIVILELSDNKLKIQLKSDSVRTFSLPIIDFDEKEQRIPNLTFPVTVTTPSTMLSGAIEDADIVGESVTFAADKDRFIINAEGDLSKANIEIKNGDGTRIEVTSDAQLKAKYSIEYLKKMIQGSKLAKEVTVYFSQDYPLKIDYKVIDKVYLSFILAPRVEND